MTLSSKTCDIMRPFLETMMDVLNQEHHAASHSRIACKIGCVTRLRERCKRELEKGEKCEN